MPRNKAELVHWCLKWAELGLRTPREDGPSEEDVPGSRRHFLHLLCPHRPRRPPLQLQAPVPGQEEQTRHRHRVGGKGKQPGSNVR